MYCVQDSARLIDVARRSPFFLRSQTSSGQRLRICRSVITLIFSKQWIPASCTRRFQARRRGWRRQGLHRLRTQRVGREAGESEEQVAVFVSVSRCGVRAPEQGGGIDPKSGRDIRGGPVYRYVSEGLGEFHVACGGGWSHDTKQECLKAGSAI